MPTYDVHARLAMMEEISDGQMDRLFDAVKAALRDYRPRAFGRPDEFVVGVIIEAESGDAARKLWYDVVDHAIDKAGVTKRYTEGPMVAETR